MNTLTIRRTAAALAVAGLVAVPVAGCTATPPAPQTGTLPTFCANPTWESDHEICARFRSVYPSATLPTTTPTTAAPKTSAAPQQNQQPGKKSGEIPTWVWVLGVVCVGGAGFWFYAQKTQAQPAHVGYAPPPQPQVYRDYDEDYDDYDEDDDDVDPAYSQQQPERPAAPAAPQQGGSGLMSGWDD